MIDIDALDAQIAKAMSLPFRKEPGDAWHEEDGYMFLRRKSGEVVMCLPVEDYEAIKGAAK
jgi:hypothetical protein